MREKKTARKSNGGKAPPKQLQVKSPRKDDKSHTIKPHERFEVWKMDDSTEDFKGRFENIVFNHCHYYLTDVQTTEMVVCYKKCYEHSTELHQCVSLVISDHGTSIKYEDIKNMQKLFNCLIHFKDPEGWERFFRKGFIVEIRR